MLFPLYLRVRRGGGVLSVFTLKLRDLRDNVILASILGGYSHIMWVRTENPVVKIFTTPDFEKETRWILYELQKEVDFEAHKESTVFLP